MGLIFSFPIFDICEEPWTLSYKSARTSREVVVHNLFFPIGFPIVHSLFLNFSFQLMANHVFSVKLFSKCWNYIFMLIRNITSFSGFIVSNSVPILLTFLQNSWQWFNVNTTQESKNWVTLTLQNTRVNSVRQVVSPPMLAPVMLC